MGAGHAHALVVERWAIEAPEGTRLTVVTDRTELLYSAMVPGLITGEYQRDELVIDAAALASRAGAELIVGKVQRIDAGGRTLHLDDGRTVAYDVASLDVGSVPAGRPDLSVVPAKAPDELLSAIEGLDGSSSGPDSSAVGQDPVVVVGGGAAGVELAATIRARLSARAPGDAAVRLVEEERRLLPGYGPRVSERAAGALRERGIDVRAGHAFAVDDEPAALVVWATGSAAPPFLEHSGLPVDAAGFVRVDETLRVVDHAELFAAGDCTSLRDHDLPKAGVHAVRQAPVLFENLVRTVESRGTDAGADTGELRSYEPRSDFLTLLNLGDGTALGTKWGFVIEGRWVRWLKDRIDRRFVQRFRR